MTQRTFARLAALLFIAVIVPACGKFAGFFVPFPPVAAQAELRGSQVVPAFTTASTGTATLITSGLLDKIDFSVLQTGIVTVSAVTVHLGAAGTNGPAIFTLATGPIGSPHIGTLTSVNFTPAPAQGVTSFNTACERINQGLAYIQITSVAAPAGEIRGQLGAVALAAAVLNGAQEIPPVATAGTGSATVQLNAEQTQIVVTLTVSGVAGITMAHLHFEDPGTAGAIIFNLSLATFTSPLTVTLTSADFLAGGGLVTFADAINALLSGRLYVNVHTGANPTGEVRGQIGPTQLNASLTGGSVVPANGSAATGTVNVALNATQTAIHVTATHNVTSPTGIVILADDPGSNGPQIFDVDAVAGSAASPAVALLNSTHLVPAPAKAITTFTEAVNAILTGRTYAEIRSAGFPAGEIRGQILP